MCEGVTELFNDEFFYRPVFIAAIWKVPPDYNRNLLSSAMSAREDYTMEKNVTV